STRPSGPMSCRNVQASTTPSEGRRKGAVSAATPLTGSISALAECKKSLALRAHVLRGSAVARARKNGEDLMVRLLVRCAILGALGSVLIGTASAQGVLPEGAKWEKVSSAGKAFAEGVVAAKDGSIYLVDLAPPGTLFRYDPKTGQTETVMSPSNLANGLHVDKNGDLLMGQGLPGSQMIVKRNLKTGEMTKVVDNHQGKKLIAPNDITTDAQGRVYFTDARFSQAEEPELPNSVYRLDPDGKLTVLTTEIGRPNGIEV